MLRPINYNLIFNEYENFKSTKNYDFIINLISVYKYYVHDMPYKIIDIDKCLAKKANKDWYCHNLSVYYDNSNVFIVCFCKNKINVFAFPDISKTNHLAYYIVKDLLKYVKTDEQDS